MTKIVIAEDELRLQKQLYRRLSEEWPEADVVACVADGKSAFEAIQHHQPDVAFLDIKMPELSGLDVAQLIEDACHIVFVTAYDEHAVAAFETGALDYVVKPITADRLRITVKRLKERLGSQPVNYAELLQAEAEKPHLSWIKASAGQSVYLIDVNDIKMFCADGKYTQVITDERQPLINLTLRDLESKLDPNQFWRVHRSTIVNVKQIAKVNACGRDNVTLEMAGVDDPVSVSRAHSSLFRKM